MNEGKRLYEFDGLRFYPGDRLLVRQDDEHPFGMTPKVSALLLVPVERRGEVVTYDEIKRKVWGDSGQALDHTLRETKRALSRTLGDRSHRLETVTGKGYRLNANVAEWEGATGPVSGIDPAGDADTTRAEDGVDATDGGF